MIQGGVKSSHAHPVTQLGYAEAPNPSRDHTQVTRKPTSTFNLWAAGSISIRIRLDFQCLASEKDQNAVC